MMVTTPLNFFRSPFLQLGSLFAIFRIAHAILDTGFNVSIPNYLFNGVIPDSFDLSASCAAAYSSPIVCDSTILISPNLQLKAETLETACNPACAKSMLMYEMRVKAACSSVDLGKTGLNGTWLEFVVSGMAGVAVYWKNCLRDTDTGDLCLISQADYELAWNAATADSANSDAVKAFCSDNCLTQTIVLNVGTQENLNELESMCGGRVDIQSMPFIDHMVFAGLLRLPGANGTTGMDKAPIVPINGTLQGAGAANRVATCLLLVTVIHMAGSVLLF